MTDAAPAEPVAFTPSSASSGNVAELLLRYPDLEPGELDRLIAGFRALPMLDQALMTADDRIRPRLDAFQRDHAPALRPPLWQYLVFLSVPGALLLALAWGLWRAAAG